MLRIPTAVFALLLLPGPASAVDVTTCGQTVPRGDVGTLTADLDCTGAPYGVPAVNLSEHATLALNGFVIRAHGLAALCEDVRKCSVLGPGEIDGAGLQADGGMILSDVYIHDTVTGVNTYGGVLRATNVTLARVDGFAIAAASVRAENLTVTDSLQFGIYAVRKFRGKTITVTGNGWSGLFSRRVVVDGLVAQGNGAGPVPTAVYGAGVQSYHGATLANAVVTGNTFNGTPLDVLTVRRPVLIASTCDHSGQGDGSTGASLGTWGVCSLD